MTSSRCGISAKQLEREVGVGYKTAWRMLNLIRSNLMCDGDEKLPGDVEADETLVGGKPRGHRKSRRDLRLGGTRDDNKNSVMAAVERDGRAKTAVIPHRGRRVLHNNLKKYVVPEAIVVTDEHPSYLGLDLHFLDHSVVSHSETYGFGSTHTNSVEGFFGNFKTSLRGTYKHVSRRWIQSYLDEFTFRHNHRNDERAMFETLLVRTATLG